MLFSKGAGAVKDPPEGGNLPPEVVLKTQSTTKKQKQPRPAVGHNKSARKQMAKMYPARIEELKIVRKKHKVKSTCFQGQINSTPMPLGKLSSIELLSTQKTVPQLESWGNKQQLLQYEILGPQIDPRLDPN